jgi:hypothetical protein
MSPGAQTVSDRIVALLDKAFADLADETISLTEVVSQATRIARLRGDFDNLHWLEMEQRPLDGTYSREVLAEEIAGHYTPAELQVRNKEVVEAYIAERTTEMPAGDGMQDETKVLALPIREIEANMQAVGEAAKGIEIPPGMHNLDTHAAYKEKQNIAVLVSRANQASARVLARIEHRVRQFLSTTEKQVLFGQVNADIFERNRRYVDSCLADVSPRALEQVSSAYQRALEGSDEARSQALLSCRRALKSVADVLCPASDGVVDDDGAEHQLTDDKWRNRLTEFVKMKLSGVASGDVLRSQLDDLARRFKGLGEASSRGVHADVTEFELNQAIIQTYLTIGDLLRLRANESGLVAVVQGLGDPTP